MLKEPFFKIESDYYMIKGVQGKDYFRIAVHGKHEDELEKLEEFLVVKKNKLLTPCLFTGENNIIFKVMQDTFAILCYDILQGAEYETGTRQHSS